MKNHQKKMTKKTRPPGRPRGFRVQPKIIEKIIYVDRPIEVKPKRQPRKKAVDVSKAAINNDEASVIDLDNIKSKYDNIDNKTQEPVKMSATLLPMEKALLLPSRLPILTRRQNYVNLFNASLKLKKTKTSFEINIYDKQKIYKTKNKYSI